MLVPLKCVMCESTSNTSSLASQLSGSIICCYRNIILMSHNTSTTQYQPRRTTVRSRTSQQRQYRLRSYGVTSLHGDGQTLLPMTTNINNNNNNNSNNNNNQNIATSSNFNNRHVNTPSQQTSSTPSSESQSHRCFPIPTTISTSTAIVTNNHR
ncbi:hypothetical protein M0802_014524 [Mischocyttarus mexicanus]|nr:hypothetical protein M0802_014524 [Mischocyttarus mexicanus]